MGSRDMTERERAEQEALLSAFCDLFPDIKLQREDPETGEWRLVASPYRMVRRVLPDGASTSEAYPWFAYRRPVSRRALVGMAMQAIERALALEQELRHVRDAKGNPAGDKPVDVSLDKTQNQGQEDLTQ